MRLANPLSDEEPLMRTTLLPPLLATLRRNLGRGHRDLALFEMAWSSCRPPDAPAPPSLGVDHRPSDARTGRDRRRAAGPAVARRRGADRRARDPAGWWGAGAAASWSDAVEAARVDGRRRPVPTATVRAGPRARRGTRAGAPRSWSATSSSGTPASCTRRSAPRSRCPERTCAMEVNLDAIPLPGIRMATPLSNYPPALIDVALVVRRGDAGRRGARRRSSTGAGELLEGVRLFDVYTSDALGAGKQVAGVQADVPGAGPHADRRGGGRGPGRGGRRRGVAVRRDAARRLTSTSVIVPIGGGCRHPAPLMHRHPIQIDGVDAPLDPADYGPAPGAPARGCVRTGCNGLAVGCARAHRGDPADSGAR